MTLREPLNPRAGLFLAASALLVTAAAAAEEKVTYADHVLPVFENHCFSCHNADRRRGGLDLSSYANALEGGSGGVVAEAGDAEASRLFLTVSHKEEPVMPPEGGRIPDADIELIRRWIEGGLLETGSSVARKPSRPKVDLTMEAPSGRPEGPPPMPQHVLLEPVVVTERGDAVRALATSPWAPLVAVGGQHQVLLYDTARRRLAGVLPYPEGFVESLRFSRSGTLLVAGAGRPGKSGQAVAWDVRTGERVMEVGREFNSAMAADITADHRLAALGSTSRAVRVFETGGIEPVYQLDRHTEWVVSVAFSPDGVLLASGDRNGNVFVHEANGGHEFYNLGTIHEGGVTDLAWRGDSNVLATAGADGRVRLWAMVNGREIRAIDAHEGGVTSVHFSHEGMLASAGSDGMAKLWDQEGKTAGKGIETDDLPLVVRFLEDGGHLVTGDYGGNVRVWRIGGNESVEVARLSSHPASIATRRQREQEAAENWQARIGKRQAALATAEKERDIAQAGLADLERELERLGERQAKLEREMEDAGRQRAGIVKEARRIDEQIVALTSQQKEFQRDRQEVRRLERSLAEAERRLRESKGASESDETDGTGRFIEMKREVEALRKRFELERNRLEEPEPGKPLVEKSQRLDRQLAELDALVRETRAELKQSEHSEREVAARVQEKKQALDLRRKAVAEAGGSLAAAQRNRDRHRREARRLEAAALNVGLIERRKQIQDIEMELEAVDRELEIMAEQAASVEAEIAEVRRQREPVVPEDRLPEQEDMLSDLTGRMNALKSERQGLAEKLAELRAEASRRHDEYRAMLPGEAESGG